MKNFFKLLSFLLLSFILISQSFAIDAPSNLKLDSTNGTVVKLSWDAPKNAYMYYVNYSKKSGINGSYDMQTDYIQSNTVDIPNLETGATYYFSVVALDENGVESIYSNELTVNVINTGTLSTNLTENVLFALDSIEVLAYNKIELKFTTPVDDSEDTTREFKISNKADTLDTFDVISIELNKEDPSKLQLTLDRDTKIGNEYEVVIVAIKNIDGKNIESGIDNTETFLVSDIANQVIDLNSAAEVAGPNGTNVSSSDLDNTTLALAEKNKKLPQTGPEHILILILSITLGALIFVFKYKRA